MPYLCGVVAFRKRLKEGMVEGSKRFGRSWAIPEDAVKPVDRRIKSGKYMKGKKN